MAYVLCVRACVWELWVLVHVPDLCLKVRLKGDVRQSRSHHFYCVSEYVLSCLVSVLVLVFFWGGGVVWVSVCLNLGEGRVSVWGGVSVLVVINPWVGCHVQVCVRVYDALFCISMPAWLFFHLSLILGLTTSGKSVMAVFWFFLMGCILVGQSQPSGVVGFKQHQYYSHRRT